MQRRAFHLARRSLAAAAPATSQTSQTAHITRPGPHDGIAFKAPPRDDTKGNLGQVFLPDMREKVVQASPRIPSEPDNYTLESPYNDNPFPTFHPPAVFTVASESTHLDGGPSVGGGDDTLLAQHGDSTSSIPREADTHAIERYEYEDRPLNPDEKSGLLALGGIVVVGFLLGGLGKPRSTKASREEHH